MNEDRQKLLDEFNQQLKEQEAALANAKGTWTLRLDFVSNEGEKSAVSWELNSNKQPVHELLEVGYRQMVKAMGRHLVNKEKHDG